VDQWSVIGIVVAGVLAVGGLSVVAVQARAARRGGASPDRDQEPPNGSPPAGAPPDGGAADPGRRDLVSRGIIALFVAALGGVVSSVLTFLWPTITGAAGGRYSVGSAAELRTRFARQRRPYFDPTGQFYVVPYPTERVGSARHVYAASIVEGMEAGFVAVSARCTHLGCQVPWCDSSQWFECPCHGSRFNRAGEQRRGPAPRGLDRYRVTVRDGQVAVDTRTVYSGPPPGTDTTHDQPAGSHCSG
jgi:cytochrome b6-f complex iron-sulfur subunit